MLISCSNDNDDHESKYNNKYSNITVSVKTALLSINEDNVFWEDRVDELRMIAFKQGTGETIFNQKLNFPNGFSNKSEAVQFPLGTYDFYFIANETTYPGDFVDAITNIVNESEFATDTRYTSIAYNPDFVPDGTSQNGRFLMSAIYDNITVASGGTEANPLPLPLPTSNVELIRSLAKVEVIFRKKVSGGSIPENTITSVQLNNVASYLSVPPYDNYYTGGTESSNTVSLSEFDYTQDSIGTVIFYIPEFLIPDNRSDYTRLNISNIDYPILSDENKAGITVQRRTVPALSDNSVIRNYHYIINAYVNSEGNIDIRVYVEPWKIDNYRYIFEGEIGLVVPPVIPTDSSIIIPTDCGKVEILSTNEYLSSGLQGAYNDVINYWDPEIQGPVIYKGSPPFYCEKKYGAGWRIMNSCELMSFLSILDVAYNVWMSNTWFARDYNLSNPGSEIPFYPLLFRQTAQSFLEQFTGADLSGTVLKAENNWGDEMPDTKLGMIDMYFTPGDIMVKADDYSNEWPFPGLPATGASESWFYNEAAIQIKAFWYPSGYVDVSNRSYWYNILYGNFQRYDYGSTVCRCVRSVD